MLPTSQVAYRKGLGTYDVFLCVSRTLQSALESGQEAWIIEFDFSAAFNRVHHVGFSISSALGIGGSVLSILMQFLSN